jgi:hypothetical protein
MMRRRFLLPAAFAALVSVLGAQTPEARSSFRIKYIAAGVVYLDGGRAAGLAEHMKLTVQRDNAGAAGSSIAELEVVSVAESSSVCEISSLNGGVMVGDVAWLSSDDAQKLEIVRTANGTKRYAQVVTFTDGDPLDEEVRELMPHPPLPEVNRIRGRIGVEYIGIQDQGGAGLNSSDVGVVFRSDMTRIGGTYWNLTGYTRFRAHSSTSGPQQETLNDLLNRTYQIVLTYNNPQSLWTAGIGRFYLPWAASLNTIDGAYIGRRTGKYATIAGFLGTTPDPTSWNYNRNRQIAGALINFDGGSFDGFKYTSTTGLAVSRLNWHPDRQFIFLENGLFYKRYFSVYHNLEADKLTKIQTPGGGGVALARSFLTLRFEPVKFIALDVSHNYFRDFPTFDPRLVGTGLLDKLLFRGLSAGVRLSLPYRATLYTNFGRSKSTSDQSSSLNQMYGLAFANILGTGVRTDVRYARFNSPFARGMYKSALVGRNIHESLRLEVQAGQQNFGSALTSQSRSRFVNGNLDWFFATHYFLGGGLTVYRGQSQNYNQSYFNIGYRF